MSLVGINGNTQKRLSETRSAKKRLSHCVASVTIWAAYCTQLQPRGSLLIWQAKLIWWLTSPVTWCAVWRLALKWLRKAFTSPCATKFCSRANRSGKKEKNL